MGTTDLRDEVERGVVVSRELHGLRVRVGSLEEVGAVPHVLSPVERPHLGIEILVPEKVGEAVLDRCEVELPGAPPIPVDVSRRALKLTVSTLTASRGGLVAFSLEGTLTSVGRTYQVNVQVKTFVRDVAARATR